MSNSLCNKKVIFLGFCKKISVSLFPFLLGFLKKIFYVCFFCDLKNDFSFCIYLFFFASSFEHCFSFLLSFFFEVSKKKRTLFLLENGAKTVFCFLFLFSWFQKHVVSEKIRFIFPLFLICCINSSLSSLKPQKIQPKNLHFLFLLRPFFCFTCFLSTFSMFLSSLFSLFTFSFHPFVHPFLLFSPFSSLSFLDSFFFSPSHVSLFFFFSIAVFVYLLFVWPHFSSLSFVLDLIFLFTLLLHHVLLHLRICFFAQNIQKFLWSIFLDEILSLFFEPSLLRCFISCFFTFASSSFLVCSMFYW